MKVDLALNYGPDSPRKRPIFALSQLPWATCSDPVTVDVPDELYFGENTAGEPLVTFDGGKLVFPLADVIHTDRDWNPYLMQPTMTLYPPGLLVLYLVHHETRKEILTWTAWNFSPLGDSLPASPTAPGTHSTA